MESRGLLIGGQEVSARSGALTEDIEPFGGETVAMVAAGGPEDARLAVDAAAAAFPEWSRTSPAERRQIFNKAAELLEARTAEVADWVSHETGALRMFAGGVHLAAEFFREAAAIVTQPLGDILPTNKEGTFSFSMRQPAGVVLGMAPWNAPVVLGVRALALPIAIGNTMVLKPSEDSPVAAALLLADILAEAGLPDGVVNVITNRREDAGAVVGGLIADPRVRRVNFTGSSGVGRVIGALAARNLKPAVLELGGKNSVIVRHDADLDHAAAVATMSSYANSGQICMCADRVLVHESVAADLTERLVAAAAELRTGDPRDPETRVGPLINAGAAERVAELVKDAESRGAKVRVGGGDPAGAIYPATVLTDVDAAMPLYQEEIFGPTCAVVPFRDDDEAVRIANDTPYGLTASVVSEDVREGLAVARRLETGMVHLNDLSIADEPQVPFGGIKDSGYGRFGGMAGIEAFSDLRWITVAERNGVGH